MRILWLPRPSFVRLALAPRTQGMSSVLESGGAILMQSSVIGRSELTATSTFSISPKWLSVRGSPIEAAWASHGLATSSEPASRKEPGSLRARVRMPSLADRMKVGAWRLIGPDFKGRFRVGVGIFEVDNRQYSAFDGKPGPGVLRVFRNGAVFVRTWGGSCVRVLVLDACRKGVCYQALTAKRESPVFRGFRYNSGRSCL